MSIYSCCWSDWFPHHFGGIQMPSATGRHYADSATWTAFLFDNEFQTFDGCYSVSCDSYDVILFAVLT